MRPVHRAYVALLAATWSIVIAYFMVTMVEGFIGAVRSAPAPAAASNVATAATVMGVAAVVLAGICYVLRDKGYVPETGTHRVVDTCPRCGARWERHV